MSPSASNRFFCTRKKREKEFVNLSLSASNTSVFQKLKLAHVRKDFAKQNNVKEEKI